MAKSNHQKLLEAGYTHSQNPITFKEGYFSPHSLTTLSKSASMVEYRTIKKEAKAAEAAGIADLEKRQLKLF